MVGEGRVLWGGLDNVDGWGKGGGVGWGVV